MIPVFSPTLFMPKASGAAFNPTSLITGGGGFWRADMGVTQAGGSLTAWADQSTFGNNLAASGQNPIFGATSFNTSFPGISFGGHNSSPANSRCNNAAVSFVSATLSTFYLVTVFNNTSGSNCSRITMTANGVAFFTTPSITDDDGGTSGQVKFDAFSSTPGNLGNGGAEAALTDSTNFLLGVTCDGTNANLWKNGATVGSATSCTSTFGSNPNEVFIGNNSGNNAAIMVIAFAGITQKAMNSTDWTNLKTWSNSNWGTSF